MPIALRVAAVRRARRAGAAVLCAFAVLAVACSHEATPPAVPNLPVDMLRALAAPDSVFRAFCRANSAERFVQAVAVVRFSYPSEATADYARSARSLDPNRERLCRCLDEEHGFATFARRHRALMHEDPTRSIARLRLWERRKEILAGSDSSDVKVAQLVALAAQIRGEDGLDDPSYVEGDIANLRLKDRHDDEYRRFIRLAVGDASKAGNDPYVCQLLGELGAAYSERGQEDSAFAIWSRGLALAMRDSLAEQSARLMTMFAAHYKGEGRPALALDYCNRAVEVCEDFGGSYVALPSHLRRLDFYATLGCWDLVERGLQIAPVLLRRMRIYTPSSSSFAAVVAARERQIREHQARLAMQRGRVSEADKLFEALDSELQDERVRSAERARVLSRWSAGLLHNGKAQEALAVSTRARDHCRRQNIPEWLGANTLHAARAHLLLDDPVAASLDLEDFERQVAADSLVSSSAWLEFLVLRLRLAMRSGDRAAVAAARHAALLQAQARLENAENRPEGHLLSAEFRELRALLQQDLRAAPALGYLTELRFREGARPRASRPDNSPGPDVQALERLDAEIASTQAAPSSPTPQPVQAMLDDLASQEAMHCLYLVDGDAVFRWTADAGVVVLDSLPLSFAHLDARIHHAVARIGSVVSASDTLLAPLTVRELHELAELLLPARVLGRAGPMPQRLYVSTDATLSLLPFAALSLDPVAYRPLVDRVDVVGLPSLHAGSRRVATGPGLIVADAKISDRMQRMHGPLPRLAGGLREAEDLRDLAPSAHLLAGPEARKDRILTTWASAPFVYFATHIVRIEGTPFACFIPLADGDDMDVEHLDWSEIAAANLTGCRLVVLSGCASGRPYVTRDNQAPGLGAAFLDAGAAAVVETAWRVEDAAARSFMDNFDRRWAAGGEDPVRALNETLRQQWRAGGAHSHPFYWAPYTIEVSSVGSLHDPIVVGSNTVSSQQARP